MRDVVSWWDAFPLELPVDRLKDNDGDDCDIVLGFGIGGDGRHLQPLKVTAIRLITSLRGFG